MSNSILLNHPRSTEHHDISPSKLQLNSVKDVANQQFFSVWKIRTLRQYYSLSLVTSGKSLFFCCSFDWNTIGITVKWQCYFKFHWLSVEYQWIWQKSLESNTNGKQCYTTVIPEIFSMGELTVVVTQFLSNSSFHWKLLEFCRNSTRIVHSTGNCWNSTGIVHFTENCWNSTGILAWFSLGRCNGQVTINFRVLAKFFEGIRILISLTLTTLYGSPKA